MGAASQYLRALIAAEGGTISVERFMREALYHPEFGYYARRVNTVGRGGDFSTTATLHPALGQAVAAWAREHRGEVTQGGRWHVIELGGGTGELAESMLRGLGWWGRRGLHYHLVEVSAGLRAEQQARLSRFRPVQWHTEIKEALAAAKGQALIFSNEFADAFPCVQLRWTADAVWQEVRLFWPAEADCLQEKFVAWQGPLPSATWVPARVPGQRVEVHLAYRDWLEQNVPLWRQGRWITIDYGDRFPGVYERRPHGTLRAYCRHQRLDGPEIYRRFGQQDLTADVNFSDLQSWGEALGLQTVGFQTQADFLRRWLRPSQWSASVDARLPFLLDPAGAGGAFKVLEQIRTATANQNAA